MDPLHVKRSKYSCPICGKFSVKLILLSFIGLIIYVGCNLLVSTSRVSVMVDMSIKMRKNVINMFNSLADFSAAKSINGTFSFKSVPVVENEREKEEHSVHFQFTDDNKISFLTNTSAEKILNSAELERDKEKEIEVKQIEKHSTSLNKPIQHSKGGNIASNRTHQAQKDSNQKQNTNITTEKKDFVDKFGNNENTYTHKRQYNCSSCFRHNFRYVIQNEQICKLHSPHQVIDLLVLIMTTHRNIRARTALRSTWLTQTKNNTGNIRHVFLLGETKDYRYKESVEQENNVYHDIVKEDFIDTYMNLTYKTIMGFKWAATKCAHAHYVLKTDDDMFVNIPNLLKIFKDPDTEKLQTSVFGACSKKERPIRNRKSKWFASEDSYPEKYYPGFCSGTGYVMSMHVTEEVYKVSPSVPFFHLEDVYVSLCIRALGFKLQPTPGFNSGRPKMDPCVYKGQKLITAHQLNPVLLQLIWHRECLMES